jgi:hypothetical protein
MAEGKRGNPAKNDEAVEPVVEKKEPKALTVYNVYRTNDNGQTLEAVELGAKAKNPDGVVQALAEAREDLEEVQLVVVPVRNYKTLTPTVETKRRVTIKAA